MNAQKQEQAKALFFQTDLSRTQIADALGVPRRTLHHWIRQNNWDRQKDNSGIMPSYLAENCYHVINRFTQQLLAAETITYQDANALHKFTLTANKLKNRSTLNEQMEVFGRFMDVVGSKSPAVAQLISPFVDEYISAQSAVSGSSLKPVTNRSSLGQAAREQQLDQQDLDFWAAHGDPLDITDQPIQEPVAGNTSDPTEKPSDTPPPAGKNRVPVDEKAEAYIDSFKQMFPDFTPELEHEFRRFYHENYSIHDQFATARAA